MDTTRWAGVLCGKNCAWLIDYRAGVSNVMRLKLMHGGVLIFLEATACAYAILEDCHTVSGSH